MNMKKLKDKVMEKKTEIEDRIKSEQTEELIKPESLAVAQGFVDELMKGLVPEFMEIWVRDTIKPVTTYTSMEMGKAVAIMKNRKPDWKEDEEFILKDVDIARYENQPPPIDPSSATGGFMPLTEFNPVRKMGKKSPGSSRSRAPKSRSR